MKLIKIFTIIVLLITIIFCLGTTTKAETGGSITDGISDIKQKSDIADMDFGSPLNGTTTVDNTVLGFVGLIISIIKTVSIIVTVISLIIIGIQYMVGSIEGKTDGKKKLNTLVIGIFFMSLVTTLVSSIFELANSV